MQPVHFDRIAHIKAHYCLFGDTSAFAVFVQGPIARMVNCPGAESYSKNPDSYN